MILFFRKFLSIQQSPLLYGSFGIGIYRNSIYTAISYIPQRRVYRNIMIYMHNIIHFIIAVSVFTS